MSPSPTTGKTVIPVRRTELIFLLGALSAFGPLAIDMYLPSLPRLARDLDAAPTSIQLTLTACLIGLAFGQLVAGPLSDAWGRRLPLLIGLVTFSVASALCAVAPSAPLLIVLRLLQGMGGAASIVVARAVVRDLFAGAEMARFFAMLMAVTGAAPILAPIIGGQLIRVTSWRGVFVLLTTIGVVLFVAALLRLPETLPPQRRSDAGRRAALRTFATLLSDRRFLGPALAGSFVLTSLFAYISGSSFVLQEIEGVSPQTFSLLFAINAAGIILFSQLSARLVRRTGSRRLLVAGLLTSLTGGVALLLTAMLGWGLIAVCVSFFLIAASVGLTMANALALALADHARVAGSASALFGVGQYALGAFAAPLVGVAGSHTALPLALIVLLSSSSACLVYLALVRSRGRDAGHQHRTAATDLSS